MFFNSLVLVLRYIKKIYTITAREHILSEVYLLFLRTLCSVLGAALVTVRNTLGIKRTTDYMVTYTGQVTYTSTTDKNNRVLLKVVTDTGNVAGSFHSVCKSYSGYLTKSRVRLLGGGCRNLCANASFLRCAKIDRCVLEGVEATLKNGSLGLVSLVLTTFFNELVKGWHDFPPSFNIYIYARFLGIYSK